MKPSAKLSVFIVAAFAMLGSSVAQAVCTFEPDSLNFSSTIVGEPNIRSFTITNTGAAPVSDTIRCIATSHFRFLNGTQNYPYSLAPGESDTIELSVEASYGGPLFANLSLGAVAAGCPTDIIPCHAYGMWYEEPGEPDCLTIPFVRMEFPPTVIGQSSVDDLWIDNSGGELPQQQAGVLMGEIPTVCGDFRIPWGGPFAITTHQVWDVFFEPTQPGWQTCILPLSGLCDDLELRGLGLAEGVFSQVSVSEIEFGMIPVGEIGFGSFHILNMGTEILSIDVPFTCGPFVVTAGAGPRNLAPAYELYVTVEYRPEAPGGDVCVLDFGPNATSVSLHGLSLEDPGAPDVIGVWFEQSGQINHHETTMPFEEVTAYLMILNPSTPYGVLGWECCVEIQGDAVALSWDLAGNAFNVDTEPCFAVGMTNGPLIGNRVIQLATVTFLQPDPDSPTYFYILPSGQPSLPGVPLYANGADPGDLIPLSPSSGAEALAVAAVNAPTTDVPELQTRTVLMPAQPNPFNPSTQLNFELAREGRARLEIHDLQGRCIRTLVDEDLAGGSHQRIWDGRDSAGRPAVSGVYFARLLSGADRVMIKMMLLK